MAKSKSKKKASHPSSKAKGVRATSNSGKRNPGKKTEVVSMSSLKAMLGGKKKPKKNGSRGYSRNPTVFGVSRPAQIMGVFAGVAGGVTAAKLIPPMLPANWSASSGMRFLTTAGVVVAISVGAHLALPMPYRDAVIVGAGSQLLSIALNPIVAKVTPSVTLEGLRRRGVGDFVPAQFPEPNNPIWRPAMAIAGATSSGGNLGRYRGRYTH